MHAQIALRWALVFTILANAACTDRGEALPRGEAATTGASASASASSTTGGAGGMGGMGGMGGAGGSGGGSIDQGSVIFGLTGFEQLDAFQSLVITRRIGGVFFDLTVYDGKGAPLPSSPFEIPFSNLAHGTLVTVDALVNSAYGQDRRVATTTVSAGHTLLLRERFSYECSIPAGYVYCSDALTCNEGQCTETFLPYGTLDNYEPGWWTYSACAPPMSGPPVVEIGQGPSAYRQLVDGDTVSLESGEQGGHHIWVALRILNIAKRPTVKLRASMPSLGTQTPVLESVATFAEETGSGYCENHHFRLQLDELVPASPSGLLGQDVIIDVTVENDQGVSASASRTVKIANSL